MSRIDGIDKVDKAFFSFLYFTLEFYATMNHFSVIQHNMKAMKIRKATRRQIGFECLTVFFLFSKPTFVIKFNHLGL